MLPREIENHILEFNPEHREKFYKCLELISVKGTNSRFNYIVKQFDKQIHDHNNWDLEAVVRTHVSDPEHFVETLASCNCCLRHTQKRPLHMNDKNYKGEPVYPITFSSRICNCPCRHASRFVFKTFNNMFDENTPFSTLWVTSMNNDDDDN